MRQGWKTLGVAMLVVSAAIACGEPTGGSFSDDGPDGFGYDTGSAWTSDTGASDTEIGEEAAPCDVPFVASRDEQSVWVRWQGDLVRVTRDAAAIAALQPTGPLQVLPLVAGGVVVHDDSGLTVLGADGFPVATAAGSWGKDHLSPSDAWLLQTPPSTEDGDIAAGEPLFTVFSLPDLVPRTFALDLDARPAAVAFGDDSTVFAMVDARFDAGSFRRVYRFDLTSPSESPASVTELGAPVSDPLLLALLGLSDKWIAPDGTGRVALPFVDPGATSTATYGLGVALIEQDGTLRTLVPGLVGPVAWSADRTTIYGSTYDGSDWDLAAVNPVTGATVDRIDVASASPVPFRLVEEPPSVILPQARYIADPSPENCWFCASGHYEYDVRIVDLTTHESRTHTDAGPVGANVVHDGWFYWLANGHLRALELPAGSLVSPGDVARRSHLDLAFGGVTLAGCDELAFVVAAQGALVDRIDP